MRLSFTRTAAAFLLLLAAPFFATSTALAAAPDAPFRAIEGGDLSLTDYRGGPVLLVNTASMCGFTYQYAGLQKLWETYRDRGLTVIAVPSDAFNQEYAENGKVKEFCEANFGITLPMTEVTPVTGPEAHPVYQWLRTAHRFVPRWNFNKVLLDSNGEFVEGWGSSVKPESATITRAIEKALAFRS